MTLHIVNKSPGQHSALQECLSHCAPEDALLLIEDGVYALAANRAASLESHTGPIYALQDDIAARGLAAVLSDRVQLVDYPGFVDLCVEHKQTLSWF